MSSTAYDTHQRLRTKAIRQLKKKAYDDAIKTISDGATAMLEQGEQGSGCDLGVYLVDILDQSSRSCDQDAREKLVKIISLAKNDFWRKKLIDAAVKWSVKASRNPAGDTSLRLAIADVLTKEGSYFIAEPHFIAACLPPVPASSAETIDHAPKAFALMMIEWLKTFSEEAAKQTGETRQAEVIERIEAGRWALRALMPLLSLKASESARGFLTIFVSRLSAKHSTLLLPVTPNPRAYTPPAGAENAPEPPRNLQLSITANPDLNFGQMALALCLHAAYAKASSGRVPDGLKNAWVALVRQYEREGEAIHEEGIGETIPTISRLYFDMQSSRPQGNFMQDMLSSLMGGGAQGKQGQIAGGAQGAPEPVQPLIIRQAPQPTFKSIDGDQESADKEEEGGLDAPEEEDLD